RIITFDDGFSKELCGGTHVQHTGEIGFFKIISESAVAAGVRRIEAITGSKAASVIREQFELVDKMRELMNSPKDFVSTVEKVLNENQELKKAIENHIREKSLQLKKELEAKVEQLDGVNFLSLIVDLPNTDAVKTLAYALKGALDSAFVVLGADIDRSEEHTSELQSRENLVCRLL